VAKLEAEKEIIIGIDLATLEKNPKGWAVWENRRISACHLYGDEEVSNLTVSYKPYIIAIDARLTMPKTDKEGYFMIPQRNDWRQIKIERQ